MKDKPVVDPGMIQVALALTAVGFFLTSGTGITTNAFGPYSTHEIGQLIFTGSGFVAAILMGAYTHEWMSIYGDEKGKSFGQYVFLLVIGLTYGTLFLIVSLSVVALSSSMSPAMRTLVFQLLKDMYASFLSFMFSLPIRILLGIIVIGVLIEWNDRRKRKK